MADGRSVFVTGATGFIGRTIARRLAAGGRRVTALVRPGRRSEPPIAHRLVEGNVWEPGEWTKAVAGHDAVIHLVGIIQPYRDNTFERVHVKGTELVTAAVREHGVRKLVHMSALGSRPDAVSQYHRSKWRAEELVRACGRATTIIRPSIVFGTPCPFIDLLKTLVSIPLVTPVAGPGTNRFQPVWVEDVARAFEASLGDARTDGQEYALGGPDVLTFDQMLDVVREARRLGPRFKLHMPLAVMRLQAAFMEAVLPKPLVTRDQLLMLGEDNTGDTAPARAVFGGDWRSFLEWAKATL